MCLEGMHNKLDDFVPQLCDLCEGRDGDKLLLLFPCNAHRDKLKGEKFGRDKYHCPIGGRNHALMT